MGEIDVQAGDAFVEPGDVLLQADALKGRGALQAKLLLHPHLDQLASTGQQVAQRTSALIGKWAHLRPAQPFVQPVPLRNEP